MRQLLNPANESLSGPLRASFPRGGPLPPPPSPSSWLFGFEEDEEPRGRDLLYPAQAVDGVVHLQGGMELKMALFAAAPVLETRPNGEQVRCRVGDAVVTSVSEEPASEGHSQLPFDAIVHTVAPFWPRGKQQNDPVARADWESMLLRCYWSSFAAAVDFARATASHDEGIVHLAIATPVLGSGARGAPLESAARVLSQAAVQYFGSNASSCTEAVRVDTSLRVITHPSGLGNKDVAIVEAALLSACEQSASGSAIRSILRPGLSTMEQT